MARLHSLSDAIFAVIITVMVLAFKPPSGHDFTALASLWPDLVSYAVSYAFIAVVWLNHHFVLKRVKKQTGMLSFANFANLFVISFIPFTTSWLAESGVASFPLTVYALVFLLVQATYMLLMWESFSQEESDVARTRGPWHWPRAWVMLSVFAIAALAIFIPPYWRLALLTLFLGVYGCPDPFVQDAS